MLGNYFLYILRIKHRKNKKHYYCYFKRLRSRSHEVTGDRHQSLSPVTSCEGLGHCWQSLKKTMLSRKNAVIKWGAVIIRARSHEVTGDRHQWLSLVTYYYFPMLNNVKCSKPFRRSHFGYSVAQQHFPVTREVTSCCHKKLRHRLLGIVLHASIHTESLGDRTPLSLHELPAVLK